MTARARRLCSLPLSVRMRSAAAGLLAALDEPGRALAARPFADSGADVLAAHLGDAHP